jgi:hypothetical protein
LGRTLARAESLRQMPVEKHCTAQRTRPQLARLAQLAPVADGCAALLALIAGRWRADGKELFSEPHYGSPLLARAASIAASTWESQRCAGIRH